MFRSSHQPITVTTLSIDVLRLILGYLDPYSLAELSQTCRMMYRMVRHELNFESAVWYQRHPHRAYPAFHGDRDRQDSLSIFDMSGHDDDYDEYDHTRSTRGTAATAATTAAAADVDRIRTEPISIAPPVYHLRCMAMIGNKLYMPFMAMDPVCFIYDIERSEWHKVPLQVYPGYTSFISPVVAVGRRLYLVGGRKVAMGTLSNEVHVIDIDTWTLERLCFMQGPLPRARCDHTVDVLQNRFLLVFGGVCANSLGENDLLVFDTITNTWSEPKTSGQIPTARFGHASAMLDGELYIFGGCETQAEGQLVHDILYRLDCRTWTWFKYDHPEAYTYRRSLSRSAEIASPGQEQEDLDQTISESLRRDLIVETTGHPPRDRLNCVLQPVGTHKLLVFGGQTIRQDGDDRNLLHAHSLRSMDVFDLRRKHWSALTTTAYDIEGSIYPHDVSSFLLDGQHDGGYRLLVIGQQKAFITTTTDSSGESTSPSMTTTEQHRSIASISPSSIPYHPLHPPTSHTLSEDPHYQQQQHQQQHLSQRRIPIRESRATDLEVYTLGRAHLHETPSLPRLSRAMADYEGFLEPSATTSEDDFSPNQAQRHHHYQSGSSNSNDSFIHPNSSPSHDNMFASLPTVASGSSPDTRADEHHISRQFTLEPLCIFLALNQE